MQDLSRKERMLLLRFVCSFAWADREIRAEERAFVSRLMRKLSLEAGERREVESWLASPSAPESVDPTAIPKEHRVQFLRAVESVIAVDGEIAPAEREQLLRFAELIRDA